MTAIRFRSRRHGRAQILVFFCLALVVLLSSLAVILDGGRVYAERRKTQNAADASATAGAIALVKSNPSGSLGAVLAAACAAAKSNGEYGNGIVDGSCGTGGSVVNIHVPGSGDGLSALPNVNPVFEAPGYVQVTILSTFRSFMAGNLGLADFAASSLAVAVNSPGTGIGDALLLLDPIHCESFKLNGTNPLNVTGGDVRVDSNASKTADAFCTNKNAATQSGGAGLNTASPWQNYIVGDGDTTNISPPWTNGSYEPDPLTRVKVPPFDDTAVSPGGDPYTAATPGDWQGPFPNPLPPGVFWGGITVKSGDTLNLAGGTYIMAGGGFNVQGGTVTANAGVTFIYTTDKYCNSIASAGCTSGGVKKHGDLDGGQSSVGQPTGAAAGSWGLVGSPLTAQTLDPDPNSLTNILIYVDRDVIPCYPDGNTTLDIGGNGGFYFATGTIVYAPCSLVRLHGNSDPPSHGGAIVAWQMTVSGTKSIDLGGPSIGSAPEPQSNLVQ